MGEKQSFRPTWLIRACRKRGWAYASPSYRLLPEATGLEILSDARDALQWTQRSISKRVIVAGSSAGGYLALAVTTLKPEPAPVALLSIYGMLDFLSSHYLVSNTSILGPLEQLDSTVAEIDRAKVAGEQLDGYTFPENLVSDQRFRWIRAMHEASLYPGLLSRQANLVEEIQANGIDEVPVKFRALFPASFGLESGFPRVVMLHGDADVFVPVDQSQGLADKLKALNVPVHLEAIQGIGHGFDVMVVPTGVDIESEIHGADQNNVYDSLRRVLLSLDRAVKGT